MDSFCFSAVPCPTRKPFLEPTVPDASLLMNVHQPNTYQAWRNGDQSKKVTTSILKKQVRFNPTYPPFQQIDIDKNQSPKESVLPYNTPPLNKVLKNKPFQEIYMANIPNRQLDLSLIDLNKPNANTNVRHHYVKIPEERVEIKDLTPARKTPTTYREFLEMQKNGKSNGRCEANDCITDIFNYTSPKIEPRKRGVSKDVEITELVNEKPENSRNLCDKLNMHKKLSSPNSDNSNMNNVREKENICHDGGIPTNQHLSATQKGIYDFREQLKNFTVQTCDSEVQTSVMNISKKVDEEKPVMSTEVSKTSDEPTVKDLLKIIQQQNEQLLVLQKQVACLLDFKDSQKRIEANQGMSDEYKFIQSGKDQRDYPYSAGGTPRKGPLPKFSIDLMTSFEVSIRPQQNMYQRKQRDFITQEPKIQEMTENDTNTVKCITDPSLYLRNPITVQENCPSPEPSINIDMKDYESSEDDEDSSSGIGASFYKKMMDQVNKMIQNAHKQTTYDGSEDLRERTLSKVRDATIKQLKKMNFSPIEEVSGADCPYSSDDDTSEQINSAVKELLMKYLPNNQLSKFARSNGATNKKRSTDKIVLNSRGPQFSFATVQFMKKYDLIANDGNDAPRRIQEKAKPSRMQNNPKILDISRLKQQPKLL